MGTVQQRTVQQAGGRIELYWLPLGAGGHSVRLNGRVFEALIAAHERRERCDLYHAALVVTAPAGRFVIELAPVPSPRRAGDAATRGVACEGPVGTRRAGRLRWFRYELRCWSDGVIPDVAQAVDSPHVLAVDDEVAERLLACVPEVPGFVWGRDEAGAGEMWNSNSVISWLLEQAGIDAEGITLPPRGRAPGWTAGVAVARRDRVLDTP